MNFAAQTTIYDSDLAAIEPEMPVVFVFNKKTFNAQRGQSIASQMGVDFGYFPKNQFDICGRFSIFPSGFTPPREEDIVSVVDSLTNQSVDYIVEKFERSPEGVAFCMSVKLKI